MKKITILVLSITLLYIILFLFFDQKIDLWIHNNIAGTRIETIGTIISNFAYGAYVKLALAIGFIFIAITDPWIKKRHTKNLFYILVTIIIAIIIGEGFKYLFGRYRPVMLFDHNLYGMQFFSTEWEINSSPSGHSIRAFAFFTALSLLYRRYAVLFILLALMVSVSRIVVTAHYPSDVLFGAFIGTMTAIWMYRYWMEWNNHLDTKE